MIIFDWDGTLCDSVEHIVAAMQGAATELGLNAPTAADTRNIIGLGLPQGVARLFPGLPEAQRREFEQAYSRQYIAHEAAPPRLFPGALDTLEALKSRGLEVAIATGKSRRGLDRILKLFNLSEFFHATRCADETRSKPHPLMIEQILKARKVEPHRALMVGDTEYDLEMATNAGVASVGVSFGVHDTDRLRSHRPLAIVDALPELLELPFLGTT